MVGVVHVPADIPIVAEVFVAEHAHLQFVQLVVQVLHQFVHVSYFIREWHFESVAFIHVDQVGFDVGRDVVAE